MPGLKTGMNFTGNGFEKWQYWSEKYPASRVASIFPASRVSEKRSGLGKPGCTPRPPLGIPRSTPPGGRVSLRKQPFLLALRRRGRFAQRVNSRNVLSGQERGNRLFWQARGECGLGGLLAGKSFFLFSGAAEATQTKPLKQSFPGGEAREKRRWEKRSRIIEGWLKG